MNAWHRWLCSAVLLTATLMGQAAEARPVAPFEATYEVRRNGEALGEATLRLQREGGNWRFDSETIGTRGMAQVAGVRIEESTQFRYVDGRPETRRYAYRQVTRFNERSRDVEVDPASGQVRLRDRDSRTEQPFVPGVLDRQLVTIALMQAVAAGRRGEQRFDVAGRREIEAQTWVVGDVEPVPMATEGALGHRIERRRDDGDGRRTVLWLDRNAGHVPLRIEQREDDGETIEMRLLRRG